MKGWNLICIEKIILRQVSDVNIAMMWRIVTGIVKYGLTCLKLAKLNWMVLATFLTCFLNVKLQSKMIPRYSKSDTEWQCSLRVELVLYAYSKVSLCIEAWLLLLTCKSLWIKAFAKRVNVNVILNQFPDIYTVICWCYGVYKLINHIRYCHRWEGVQAE